MEVSLFQLRIGNLTDLTYCFVHHRLPLKPLKDESNVEPWWGDVENATLDRLEAGEYCSALVSIPTPYSNTQMQPKR